MKKYLNKLSALLYFTKIDKNEKAEMLESFNQAFNGNTTSDPDKIYRECKAKITLSYKTDVFKICLLVLSALSVLPLIFIPIVFNISAIASGLLVCVCYVLFPLLVICYAFGLIAGKIKFSQYKLHWGVLALQVALALADILYVLYQIASSLEGF